MRPAPWRVWHTHRFQSPILRASCDTKLTFLLTLLLPYRTLLFVCLFICIVLVLSELDRTRTLPCYMLGLMLVS
jgi:hypothetical protein